MLSCCCFAITSVQRFGGGNTLLSSVWSLSQGLWHFHQGSRWWQRDDPHYDYRSPKFKCKWNSSLQDNCDLKWSCQLWKWQTQLSGQGQLQHCVPRRTPYGMKRDTVCVLLELGVSRHHFCSQPSFTQTSWASFPIAFKISSFQGFYSIISLSLEREKKLSLSVMEFARVLGLDSLLSKLYIFLDGHPSSQLLL